MSLKVVLASGSPQRRELLKKLGVEFEVFVPGVEELTDGDPARLVVENARRNAEAFMVEKARRKPEAVAFDGLVIACDTDVVLDGEVLGKPVDEADARGYLDRLSGRAHTVLSGLVVAETSTELSPDTGDVRNGLETSTDLSPDTGDNVRSGLEATTVVFKKLTEEEKDRYVRFGEWQGRSGGYAIQTLGSTLVERLEGSVSNVVGLPVGLLAQMAPALFE